MSPLEYNKDGPFYNHLNNLPTNNGLQLLITVSNRVCDNWKELTKYNLSQNTNIIYLVMFDKLFTENDNENAVMISQVLPNISDIDSTLINWRNKIFVRNFIGFCIWKNMNTDGSPMIK